LLSVDDEDCDPLDAEELVSAVTSLGLFHIASNGPPPGGPGQLMGKLGIAVPRLVAITP
jgi:hypothetical protein